MKEGILTITTDYSKSTTRTKVNYNKKITSKLEERLKEEFIEEPYFSNNALTLLRRRYLVKDKMGNPTEIPKDALIRVAVNIAYADFNYNADEEQVYNTAKLFYEMMSNKKFLPNSPTIMNAGRPMQQLAACFVLPIEDSMEGILGSIMEGGLIHRSGGGTGYSFSRVRRKNAFVSTTYGKASGPVSFMQAYDAITESVNQGGYRRGANMGILKVDHPDILEFIRAKESEESRTLKNFNISVAVTDEFMQAVKNNDLYQLVNHDGSNFTLEDIIADKNSAKWEIALINEEDLNYDITEAENGNIFVLDNATKEVYGKINDGNVMLNARQVFYEIIKYAWNNGEPGMVFIDNINKDNPTPKLGKIESTNPCGEQPLLPYEACNLGSINLERFVRDNEIDYERLGEVVRNSVHFLDNVIDMSSQPLPQIEKMVKDNRKIGLGVMGFADLLIKLGIPYNSKEAVQKAEEIMRFIQQEARKKSRDMAKERGVFPNFKDSIYNDGKEENRLRNATLTTIAPTGSIGIIADVFSRGIEPLHALLYGQRDADGHTRKYVCEPLKEDLIKRGIDPEYVFRRLEKGESLQDLPLSQELKKIYVTTNDIGPEDHINIQIAFQKYTDNAVSKTINFPFTATIDDIFNSYIQAYEKGCKGLTVYRKGSREDEVIVDITKEGLTNELKKVPKIRPAFVREESVGPGQKLFVIPTYVNGERRELFGVTNFADPDQTSLIDALFVRYSKDLRRGISPEEIADDINQCNHPREHGGWDSQGYYNRSIPGAISRTLSDDKLDINHEKVSKLMKTLEKELNKFTKKGDEKKKTPKKQDRPENLCRDCGEGTIISIEGCMQCDSCGHSPRGCS